jgi:quercetin dioxygenase-like cupin family protein
MRHPTLTLERLAIILTHFAGAIFRCRQEKGDERIGNTVEPFDEPAPEKRPARVGFADGICKPPKAVWVSLGRAPGASSRSTDAPHRFSRLSCQARSPERNEAASELSQVALALSGACLVFLSALPAWAENAYPTVDLLSTGKTIVGEEIKYPTTGPAKVTASIVSVAPGAETVFHQHGVPMFAYMLEGTLTVDYGQMGKKVYKPGDALVEAMAVTHRGTNLGPVPVRILAVYMGAEGSKNVILDPK